MRGVIILKEADHSFERVMSQMGLTFKSSDPSKRIKCLKKTQQVHWSVRS